MKTTDIVKGLREYVKSDEWEKDISAEGGFRCIECNAEYADGHQKDCHLDKLLKASAEYLTLMNVK